MHHYLISYLDIDAGRVVHGNANLTLPAPITNWDEAMLVQDSLRRQYNLNQPILMGFSRYDNGGGQ